MFVRRALKTEWEFCPTERNGCFARAAGFSNLDMYAGLDYYSLINQTTDSRARMVIALRAHKSRSRSTEQDRVTVWALQS
jgi:hypothetical protein